MVAVTAAFATAPPSARAQQQPEWLLVPSAVAHEGEGTPIARRASQQFAHALGSSVRLIPPERARSRFEQRGSTAPLMVSHGDLDALARDAQMALYHVASGLPAKARQDVTRALTRADKVLESLNRESLAAQQLLDACLYLVRAHLQSNERQAAREQALQCRRLVPDIEPDGTMHPPEVIGILAEAEAELRQREPGSLRVESLPETCAVYVNGRHLGAAPLELPQLSPGEYRVQAECEEGRAGRVHRVTIGSARVVKRIDTRFDAAVQTSLDVSLRYEAVESQRDHAYADALEIGRVIGAGEVALLLPVARDDGKASDVVQIDRIRVKDGQSLATVRVRLDSAGAIEAAALAAAVRALLEGRSLDLTQPTPVAVAAPEAIAVLPVEPSAQPAPAAPGDTSNTKLTSVQAGPTAAPVEAASEADVEAGATPDATGPRAHSSPSRPLGIALAIVGGAAAITGWALFGHQLSLEQAYRDRLNSGADASVSLPGLNHFTYVPFAVQMGASALLVAAQPWLLPPASSPRVPVWGWVVGGIGAGVAIAGAVFTIRGASCNAFDQQGRCSDVLATTRFGLDLLAASAPLLSVPVVYLLRGGVDKRDTGVVLGPPPSGGGAQLTWRGQL
ncbi:MAG: PEGA domain-containing protein [Polyangiales bacterium]